MNEMGDSLDLGEIRLLQPVRGDMTLPLQLYAWPEDVLVYDDDLDLLDIWYSLDGDRSHPRPVTFAWERPRGIGNSVRFDLLISNDRGFPEPGSGTVLLSDLIDTRAEVYNLRIGTCYYWKVIAHRNGNGTRLVESAVEQFYTHPAPPRWIRVPGITNVRDIGGWPVQGDHHIRQGLIFRGSEMNNHCTISPEGQQVMVNQLGLRTDVDLRGVGEERMPVLDSGRVEYVNIPVLAYDSIVHPEYTGRYRDLFRMLTDPGKYPLFIHCWGGADRTGTLVFLIQALLGMSEVDLFTDYELTSLSVWGERRRSSEAFQDLLKTLELFGSRSSTIQAQVQRYLTVIGVTRAEIEKIKELLIE
jgi:protein-tyrosine phosphatase